MVIGAVGEALGAAMIGVLATPIDRSTATSTTTRVIRTLFETGPLAGRYPGGYPRWRAGDQTSPASVPGRASRSFTRRDDDRAAADHGYRTGDCQSVAFQ